MDVYEQQIKAYKEDPRTACQYGSKCYQKNPAHHSKYKHPPKKQENSSEKEKPLATGRKRGSSELEDDASEVAESTKTKVRKEDKPAPEIQTHEISPSPSPEITDDSDSEVIKDSTVPSSDEDTSSNKESKASPDDSRTSPNRLETVESRETKKDEKVEEEVEESAGSDEESTDAKKIISDLFLVKMPKDFYDFYDFCVHLSSKDPCNALKQADLRLVGPYDVLNGKIKTNKQDEPEKFLRHWRYYYDPPEFQTILKGNDKEGLHYGYWRDDPKDLPIFVAKNNANHKDCKITVVAPNIFAAVANHLEEKRKKAGPFEKLPLERLTKQLKAFATEKDISLKEENAEMRTRERKMVTKTFHGAGIVVPYDKKTQLGYRDLAATDSHFKKMLKNIDNAKSDDERRKALSSIDEIVRLATIAADESDFGTCLELGHDLFTSGVERVQQTGLQMLVMSYNLLHREKFLRIAQAHAKDRKKGCDLSVL